jgi:hypothetical protein
MSCKSNWQKITCHIKAAEYGSANQMNAIFCLHRKGGSDWQKITCHIKAAKHGSIVQMKAILSLNLNIRQMKVILSLHLNIEKVSLTGRKLHVVSRQLNMGVLPNESYTELTPEYKKGRSKAAMPLGLL